jgi:hypothetical protein
MFGLLNWWWTGNWSVWTLQPQARPSLLALSLSLSLSLSFSLPSAWCTTDPPPLHTLPTIRGHQNR